ncbi:MULTISPECIES: hypothetical protein [Jannaschia]|uniref:hypothetical protein n=1 Tax=Jannaschia TaxID=188905 RepID=UPI001C7CD6CA|nr:MULTISPECIES: hypothetical protein [unclassified Jannaschia]
MTKDDKTDFAISDTANPAMLILASNLVEFGGYASKVARFHPTVLQSPICCPTNGDTIDHFISAKKC